MDEKKDLFDRISEEDLKEVCGLICPYCAANIDFGVRLTIDNAPPGPIYHVIPGTQHNYKCDATKIWEQKLERYEARRRNPLFTRKVW